MHWLPVTGFAAIQEYGGIMFRLFSIPLLGLALLLLFAPQVWAVEQIAPTAVKVFMSPG